MAEYVIANKTDLVSIADSIREKAKLNNDLTFPNGFINAVNGISTGATVTTSTIKESQANYSYSLTIPELIGAKYFVIKGNYLTAYQFGSSDIIDNSGTIHTLLYIDGKMIVYYSDLGANNGQCDMACSVEMTSGWSFDKTTGTISFVDYCFSKFTTDTTEGDVAYTVYRFG